MRTAILDAWNKMEKKETLFKVTITVSSRLKKAYCIVAKSKGTERGNSFLITSMDERGTGVMEDLYTAKTIPKTSLMQANPSFGPRETSCGVWCHENQVDEAKALCDGTIELGLLKGIQGAIAMNDLFQEYKSKINA